MPRGDRYPAEGFDGSPYFFGKKRKPAQDQTTIFKERKLNIEDEELIIEEVQKTLEPKRFGTNPAPNTILGSNGAAFDFSADIDVISLNKTVNDVLDLEGKKKDSQHAYTAANISAKKEKILSVTTKKKANKSFVYQNLAGDFRSAAGSSVVKEVKRVVAPDVSRASSDDNACAKYFGNKRVGPANSSSPTRDPIKMGMTTDGGGRDKKDNTKDPALKNFDDNIISLIESEIMRTENDITWEDVSGLESAKKALREIVVLPFQRPDIFKKLRAPPKGVLLFGPPGTGKTMIGRCVASQCNATFFNISAASLTSKWVGEGEKLVRALFAMARIKLPSIIFIDEIDSLLSSRSESEHESSRRIKTEFLVQLDGVATKSEEKLLVIGATNRPYELDEAARRRFAKRLYIALPNCEARLGIVRNLLHGMDYTLTENDYKQIGNLTEGYSGADMKQLCSEAAMGPIREIDERNDVDILTISTDQIRFINGDDFILAAKSVRATVVEEDLKKYIEWDKKFGCLL